MTWRRLGVLIERLPPESATKTAMRDAIGAVALAQRAQADRQDGGYGPYSNTDMHLSMLIDEIRWLRYAVYQSQGGKPKKPAQYPRPGVIPTGRKMISQAGRDYLADIRARQQAARPQPAVTIPAHIATAAHKKLGPAERQWLTDQLEAMRRPPAAPPQPE